MVFWSLHRKLHLHLWTNVQKVSFLLCVSALLIAPVSWKRVMAVEAVTNTPVKLQVWWCFCSSLMMFWNLVLPRFEYLSNTVQISLLEAVACCDSDNSAKTSTKLVLKAELDLRVRSCWESCEYTESVVYRGDLWPNSLTTHLQKYSKLCSLFTNCHYLIPFSCCSGSLTFHNPVPVRKWKWVCVCVCGWEPGRKQSPLSWRHSTISERLFVFFSFCFDSPHPGRK